MNTAAVTSAATLGGNAAFSYNRENYMFDSGQRWARYMAGYTFACDQVGQYREDIDQLGDISIAKMDNIHAVSGLMMVIVIQLIMAGRLGVHGPAPPGWLMGMYWVNCGLMCMWLMLAAWLAIHGGARAQAGVAYLKTRSVRLPIPTPKQMDKARVYGNHWERQRFWDVFRVPFVAPAPVDDPVDHPDEEGPSSDGSAGSSIKSGPGKKKRATAGPVDDFRTPAWVNEEIRELHGGSGGAPVSTTSTPEHFELFRGLQHEWWQFETYARISIFFAFTHWMSAASLYIMCHCFIELRAPWPAFSCVFMLVAAHYCINMIDVLRVPRDSSFFNVPMELVVPFPPLICVLCMHIDFSGLEEWRGSWVVFVWGCSFACYIVYFLWALRMYDLCRPNKTQREMIDSKPTQPWWPGEWSLPISFQHALYFVAPPKFLEPGESCLWQEMKAGRGSQNKNVPEVKQREAVVPNDTAWRVCRAGNFVSIFLWVFILGGRLYALAWTQADAGDMRFMLKQEGRVMRWPSHMQPWMAPWTRLGSRNEWCHTGGCDRRLGESQSKSRHEMAGVAERLMPTLQTISEGLQQKQTPIIQEKSAQENLLTTRASVDWPSKFMPELITCSHQGHVAALARGIQSGALVHDLQSNNAAQRFTFEGIDHLGEILGSHWGEDGMLLTMKNGGLAECTGMPANGLWPCQQLSSQLPLGGSALHMAVVARVPTKKQLLRAAVVYDGDTSVTLFETEGDSGVWFPTGEAHLPSFLKQAPSFSMSRSVDELILMAEGGSVLKWSFTESVPKTVAPPPREAMAASVVWQTACELSGKKLIRLAHRQTEGSIVPEAFVSDSL